MSVVGALPLELLRSAGLYPDLFAIVRHRDMFVIWVMSSRFFSELPFELFKKPSLTV